MDEVSIDRSIIIDDCSDATANLTTGYRPLSSMSFLLDVLSLRADDDRRPLFRRRRVDVADLAAAPPSPQRVMSVQTSRMDGPAHAYVGPPLAPPPGPGPGGGTGPYSREAADFYGGGGMAAPYFNAVKKEDVGSSPSSSSPSSRPPPPLPAAVDYFHYGGAMARISPSHFWDAGKAGGPPPPPAFNGDAPPAVFPFHQQEAPPAVSSSTSYMSPPPPPTSLSSAASASAAFYKVPVAGAGAGLGPPPPARLTPPEVGASSRDSPPDRHQVSPLSHESPSPPMAPLSEGERGDERADENGGDDAAMMGGGGGGSGSGSPPGRGGEDDERAVAMKIASAMPSIGSDGQELYYCHLCSYIGELLTLPLVGLLPYPC